MSFPRNCLLALLLCLLLLAGCAAPVTEHTPTPEATVSPSLAPSPSAESAPTPTPTFSLAAELADAFPLRMGFSSGAGGWSTDLTLQEDFSFEGTYHDSDMGSDGEGYPNGTRYVCSFRGQFGEIRQLDAFRYALTLTELTSDYEEGKEWIEDGILFVSSVPFGMETGTEFILYLPNTPVDGLSEDFLSWWPFRYWESSPETLELFGLYNMEPGYGFFG